MTERRPYSQWRPFIGGEIETATLVADPAGPAIVFGEGGRHISTPKPTERRIGYN
jgi:hypothetical protein